MCIIIYKPQGVDVPKDRLLQSNLKHPHGSGIAWADGKRVKIKKGFNDFGAFLDHYKKVKKYACIIHFRYMTEGKEQASNCHPFQLGKSLAVAHNGTIRGIDGVSEDVSDTRAFVTNYLRPMIKMKPNWAYTQSGQRWMKTIINANNATNKLCFMNRHGTPAFVNGDLGHWSMECWYSNKTYIKPKITKPKRGYGLLSDKFYRQSQADAIIGKVSKPHFEEGEEDAFGQIQMPIGYGSLRTGRSMIDELEDELSDHAEANSPDLFDDISEEESLYND